MQLRAVLLAAVLVTTSLFAQDSSFYHGPAFPHFGVGIELLRPVLRVADVNQDVGIEVFFSYRVNEKRSWRLDYGFRREEDENNGSWTVEDSLLRSSSNAWFSRHHEVSVGHQWELSNGLLRPFLGVDLIIGYHEQSFYNGSTWYSLDSLGAGAGTGIPLKVDETFRYSEIVRVGLGGAFGVEYRPHKHLSIQLRASVAQFFTIPLTTVNARPELDYGQRGPHIPDTGSGLFVQFRF